MKKIRAFVSILFVAAMLGATACSSSPTSPVLGGTHGPDTGGTHGPDT